MRILPRLVLGCALALTGAANAAEIVPIKRSVPPPGTPLGDADRARLQDGLSALEKRIASAPASPALNDVIIFTKAVSYALRFDEFWDLAKETPRADWALQQARERLDKLAEAPWLKQTGLQVRGFVSAIDGSVQPYGLVIPEHLDTSKPVPLYIWLHGRSEQETDLHFLANRSRSAGEIHPDGVIMAHAFGRMCVGFKSAGEIDVIDLIAEVSAHYRIDPERVVLMGFSMGGAGAKHIGAHYTDHFAAIHAGAGFAETARYLNLKKEDFPPGYEQTLWGDYDVPDYIRNLFDVPFIAYSGEQDKQIQAAQVLAEYFKANGHELVHLIGPGVGHKYQADTLKQVLALVHTAVEHGRPMPETISFETRTLRYDRMFWVQALGLKQHWQDARIDAAVVDGGLRVTTSNITSLKLTWPGLKAGTALAIDNQKLVLTAAAGAPAATLAYDHSGWAQVAPAPAASAGTGTGSGPLSKRHGLQGPIDDAFLAPFLVVLPSKPSRNERFQRWCQFESRHFIERWAALMRGEVRIKSDAEVTAEDMAHYNLVLWGDAESNRLIGRIAPSLPIAAVVPEGAALYLADAKGLPAVGIVPVLIYPNPLSGERYVVINSGLTFREGSDHTNSLQNPKLPDWAAIDLSHDPDENAPGLVTRAGFFDEQWKAQPASP